MKGLYVPDPSEDENREPDHVGPKIVAGLAMAGAGIRLGPEAALALGAASPVFELLAERAWEELRPTLDSGLRGYWARPLRRSAAMMSGSVS